MRNFRILHVEDDDNDAMLVQHAFRKEAPQASLVVVTDGRAAQDYLAASDALPDLVLMDLKLPRMTGLEVLEWMKEQPRLQNLPVFILSSSSEKQDVERAQALGVAGYLSKQGSLKGLIDIVRDLVAFVDRR